MGGERGSVCLVCSHPLGCFAFRAEPQYLTLGFYYLCYTREPHASGWSEGTAYLLPLLGYFTLTDFTFLFFVLP